MTPGKFFVLRLDFSGVGSSPYAESADKALKSCLHSLFLEFCDKYAAYLGGDSSKWHEHLNPEYPANSLSACVRVVNSELLNARMKGDKRLADVEGVSCSLFKN